MNGSLRSFSVTPRKKGKNAVFSQRLWGIFFKFSHPSKMYSPIYYHYISSERYGFCIYFLLALRLLHFSSVTFFNTGLYISQRKYQTHVVFPIRFAVPLPAFKAVVGSFNKLSLVPLQQLQGVLFWGRGERDWGAEGIPGKSVGLVNYTNWKEAWEVNADTLPISLYLSPFGSG